MSKFLVSYVDYYEDDEPQNSTEIVEASSRDNAAKVFERDFGKFPSSISRWDEEKQCCLD